jgi:hypothetical protein
MKTQGFDLIWFSGFSREDFQMIWCQSLFNLHIFEKKIGKCIIFQKKHDFIVSVRVFYTCSIYSNSSHVG